VKPIDSWDEVAALWPADDDPDELFDFIISERKARRALAKKESDTVE
jgi:hypothetical protein